MPGASKSFGGAALRHVLEGVWNASAKPSRWRPRTDEGLNAVQNWCLCGLGCGQCLRKSIGYGHGTQISDLAPARGAPSTVLAPGRERLQSMRLAGLAFRRARVGWHLLPQWRVDELSLSHETPRYDEYVAELEALLFDERAFGGAFALLPSAAQEECQCLISSLLLRQFCDNERRTGERVRSLHWQILRIVESPADQSCSVRQKVCRRLHETEPCCLYNEHDDIAQKVKQWFPKSLEECARTGKCPPTPTVLKGWLLKSRSCCSERQDHRFSG